MRLSSPHPQLRPGDGCVVSYCGVASAVGARVLREGGNAADAAVATALALAVTYPQAGNLGGGGFLLHHGAGGEVSFLDYRETAPRKLERAHFHHGEAATVLGALSVAVPGTVAGLAQLLERFGTFSWERLVGYAAELAETGVWLTARQAGYLELHGPMLSRFESTRRCFFPDGNPPLPGTLHRQPELAATLRTLAAEGPRSFYEGFIARAIAREIARGGGVLDEQDLAGYAPVWRTPLRRRFLGAEIFTAAAPSAGGPVLDLALALLDGNGAHRLERGSVERLDLMARIFRVAWARRWPYAGDPDARADEPRTVLPVGDEGVDLPVLERAVAAPPAGDDPVGRRASTVHFCVADAQGNLVSNTYSLNTMFGSKLVVDGAGFLLNNSIDDFAVDPDLPNWYETAYSPANRLAPGRRPSSSMAPTVVRANGRTLALGGSGGPRIPTLVAQVLLGVLGDGLLLADALAEPRVHHQWVPDQLAVDRRVPAATAQALTARGRPVVRMPLLGLGAGIDRSDGRGEGTLVAALDDRMGIRQ